ncbi:MAG: Ig-like domain-containing protein [Candidatus Microsaccharimonas sp.]
MRAITTNLYQRGTNFALALMLVISAIVANVPFIFSDSANAAPGTTYVATALDSLVFSPDRSAPSGGYTPVGNALTLNVDNNNANTSATFYQTEGLQAPITTSQTIKAELYVDPSWTAHPVRAGLWGVAGSDTASDVAWPIIEYTTIGEGGFTGWRVFDTMLGGWTNLTTPATDQWYTLEISYNGGTNKYDYYVNDVLLVSKDANWGSDVYNKFQAVIFNNFNSATLNSADNYSVQWRNFSEGNHQLSAPVNLTPADNSYTNDHAFSMTWDTVAGASKYEYRTANSKVDSTTLGPIIYSDASDTASNYDLGLSTITRHNNGTPANDYFWQVRAGDNDGHWSDWSVINKVTVDLTAPTKPVLALPSNGSYLPTNEFDFDWNDSTDVSPLTYEFQASQDPSRDSNDILNGSNIWQSGVLPTSMIHSSGAPDGAWFYQVRAKDAAGNYSLWSDIWSVIIDQQAPTANFIFPGFGPSANGFTVQFNEAVNPTEAADPANYFLNNWPGAGGSGDLTGDATVSYNPATHVATVTFTSSAWYISAEQQWGLQNIHDLADNLVTPNPTTAYSSPLVDPSATGTPSTTDPSTTLSLDWTWTAATDPGAEEASGIKGYEYALVAAGDTPASWTFTTNTSVTTVVPADGDYELYVRALDNAGNTGIESIGTVTVDATDPDVEVNASTANTSTPTVTGTIDDSTAVITLTVDGGTPLTATNNGDGTWSYTFTTPLSDGTYTIEVTATDVVGNTDVASASLVIATAVPTTTTESTSTPTIPVTTATITPLIVGPAAVLGAETDNTGAATNNGESDVEGATDNKTAAADTKPSDAIFGLAWYWWILVLLGATGLIWFIIAAIRRRNNEE